ncbi:TraM recognition domain-containing protein [Nocardioides sp. NPDC051685]|uniref:type IV secretory system conjugative DNA transfer family protein n=1 Tax=Nocardioides sp. NPDC051685 TaxID=3364334 RepID=UPI0037AD3377
MTGPHARQVDDELVNLGLVLVLGGTLVLGLLRLAGTIAAWLPGATPPRRGLVGAITVIAHPLTPASAFDTPGLPAIVYWFVVIALTATSAAVMWAVWRVFSNLREASERDVRHASGVATRRDVIRTASERSLLKRAGNLRPDFAGPSAEDVGYLLGHARGGGVWSSVEDSTLILGPPRSGKGVHLVINAILDAPGPVVTTATRPDNITTTLAARRERGPVAVFDPQHLADGLPHGLRWSPVRGCQDPLTAMIRATGLASAIGLSAGGVDSGSFWEGKTRTVLQSLLHAAALDARTPAELLSWTLSPASAADAVAILANHSDAATGWAESLDSMIESDPRTRDSIWMGVSLALSSLADPRVLDSVSPGENEEFDPTDFLRDSGALYLLATGAGSGACWPLVAAFVEDLVETARHLAACSPGARLEPPLLLALDEIGNLAPLPSLPTLMAEGGGTGITTMPVLQSLSQARDKWREHAANAIWDAAIVKVILGGTAAARDLQDLSTLIGERDEHTDTITVGDYGSRGLQRSTRRVPILPPDTIRTLPFGMGLVLLRSAPPIVTDLRRWTDRPDGAQLSRQRKAIEGQLGHPSARA